MIRLGHIDYANCVPIHGRLLSDPRAAGLEVVTGVPSDLNAKLAAGDLDVAPCSSIEYARHYGEYRLLPGFGIGSDGAVGSIRLESTGPVDSLAAGTVFVPTASATSVVMLRILLEVFRGLKPAYSWYRQEEPVDPIERGAAAVLRIGDIALRRETPAGRQVLDLGADWTAKTGLPFVYAVWQARRHVPESELIRLHTAMKASRAWHEREAPAQAETLASHFGLPAEVLLRYWRSLRYDLDGRMQSGLLEFYRLAARVGEPFVPALEWAIAPGAPDPPEG